MKLNILYGVVGEGMGHATRSAVIIEHLLRSGHTVKVLASCRAYEFLQNRFSDVQNIHGLHIVYGDNTVRKTRTIVSNLIKPPKNLGTNISRYFHLIGDFKANLVISDFDSFTYLYAKRHRLPVISIDNMQAIDRCVHPDIPGHYLNNYRMTKTLIKGKLPRCDHYLISSFMPMQVNKSCTTIVPPILRQQVLDTITTQGQHVLVYQTSPSFQNLVPALGAMKDIQFKVYGLRRREDLGNVQLYNFNESGFIEDLASSRAVIANGGFSLMSEAIYHKKPMLTIPVSGQFEQVFNGLYLQKMGYGESWDTLDPDLITHFLKNVPTYQRALNQRQQQGNSELFANLDRLLRAIAKGERFMSAMEAESMDIAA